MTHRCVAVEPSTSRRCTIIRLTSPRPLGPLAWVSIAGAIAAALLVTAAAPPVDAAGKTRPHLVINTALGTGDATNASDGRPARTASIQAPQDVATAPDGTMYVLTGLQVRAVDPKTKRVSTLAGTGKAGYAGDGGPATKARFSSARDHVLYGAQGLAVGPDGTVYVADAGNHRIRAIDPETKKIHTVAGTGRTGDDAGRFGGDSGPAKKAHLFYPKDVTVDAKGNLYIADYLNYRVRKVSAKTGKIRTIAGKAHSGDSGSGFFPEPDDEGSHKATRTFVEPDGIAVGPDGTVYFTDKDDDLVHAIDVRKDKISTVAGKGISGITSYPNDPTGLAVSADGKTLYIAGGDSFATDTTKNRVFALDLKKKKLRTFAGGGTTGALGDGGEPTKATITGPGPSGTTGLATAKNGDVYVTDERNQRVRVIGMRTTTRQTNHSAAKKDITTLVGSGKKVDADGSDPAPDPEDHWYYRDVHALDDVDLDSPDSVAVDTEDGTLYLADPGKNRIRAVDPDDGVVRTVAGRKDLPDSDDGTGDGGKATEAYLNSPKGLALGPNHKLYFVDRGDDDPTVRVIDLDEGTVNVAPGAAHEFEQPASVAVGPGGSVYVVDHGGGDDARACVLQPAKDSCKTIAGDELSSPSAVTVGPHGTVYVAESALGGRVRAVSTKTGKVRSIAGYLPACGGDGEAHAQASGNGGPALGAVLGDPGGMTIGPGGWLYLTDRANHRVRAVNLETGVIRAVSGTGKYEQAQVDGVQYGGGKYAGDGGPAGKAALNAPADVAVGPHGELYVADTGNNRIRVIGDTDIEPGLVIHPLVWWIGGPVLAVALCVAAYIYRRRRRHRLVATALAAGRATEATDET